MGSIAVADEALLEVDELVSGYGQIQVLHAISVRVGAREAVGLFGPNGHGKTTLLRTISGLLKPWKGQIRFMGMDIRGHDPRRIVNVGLIHVAQGNTLFPGMSVMENLQLGAYRHAAWPQRHSETDKVFDLFPRLKERRAQLCRTLSGGERQMLSIGMGLMARPQLLMLDEPTLGLAPRLKDELSEAVRRIAEEGVPLLIVDQDIEFLLGLTRRLYLVQQGRIALEGQAGEVGAYEDEILAGYFGTRV